MVVDGVDVRDVTAASADLAFTAVLPDSLGTPSSIQVTDPLAASSEQRVFGAMFLDDGNGLFWVLEEEAEVQQDDLLTLLKCDPDAGCEGTLDPLDLGDGVVGIVIGGPEVTSVRWIYKGVQFDVLGPSTSLSSAEAGDIAQAIANEAQAVR